MHHQEGSGNITAVSDGLWDSPHFPFVSSPFSPLSLLHFCLFSVFHLITAFKWDVSTFRKENSRSIKDSTEDVFFFFFFWIKSRHLFLPNPPISLCLSSSFHLFLCCCPLSPSPLSPVFLIFSSRHHGFLSLPSSPHPLLCPNKCLIFPMMI